MAKKPKAPKLTKEQQQSQKDIARLKDEVTAGKGIADDLGLTPGSLGRVDDTLPSFATDPNILNVGELLARLRAQSYVAGHNTDEQNSSIKMLGDLAANAGTRSGDVSDIIQRRKDALGTAGNADADQTNYIDLLKSEYANARNISPDVQNALDVSRAGLGGLTSAENQALTENLTMDTNRAFQGGLRAARGAGLTSGTGVNPAMVRQLLNDYTTGQFQARNDVLARNADIQDRRLGAYAGLSTSVDDALFGRAQQTLGSYGTAANALNDLLYRRSREALGDYESSVNTAEGNEFDRSLAAKKTYSDTVETNVNNNRTDILNNLKNYQDELFRTRADNFNRVTTNMNTNAAELSSRTGAVLSVPAYLQSVRSARSAEELAKAQIEAAKSFEVPSGDEGSSGGGGNSDTFDSPRSNRSVASTSYAL